MPTTLEQIQYGFDRDSRRTWQRRSLTDTQDQHYSYDPLSQVSAAARGSLNLNKTAISGVPASAQSWDYDPTGNWRGYHNVANGTSTLDQHRVHDSGNRLTQIEDIPHNMILDRVGRMRQMAPDASGDWDGKLEITWDAWSRIKSVKNNGEVVGAYTYEGSHRRITREVDGETLHSYYNDKWRPVEERKNSETTASVSYLWGSRHRDDLVRRDRAVGGTTLNETRYVLMDYFNPAAITDASGVVKERYAFSAYGVRTLLNSDFTVRSSSECGMEFAFQGQFIDVESGLMNYGYRYYSPQLGRWTCKDPIGEEGGVNLYVMSLNCPLNLVDRFGLDIHLTEGASNADWWRIGVRYFHMAICVDEWEPAKEPDINCCMESDGRWFRKSETRFCISFRFDSDTEGTDPIMFRRAGWKWLGRKTSIPVMMGWTYGVVYQSTDYSFWDISTLKTKCSEDREFKVLLQGLLGTRDKYEIDCHSCRTFSKMMFDEAMRKYGKK